MATQVVENIPNGFLTREQAMKMLGKSDTSIERLVRAGELESKLFPIPGRRPIRYYTNASVETFAKKEEKRLAARPPSQLAPKPPQPLALAVPDAAITTLRELIERLTAPKPLDVTEKLWLSLDEGGAYSGLARADLLKLCQEGKLIARKSGGWKILRKSLEAFEG